MCILEITEDAAVDLVNFKDNRGRFKANKSRRREKITPTFLQDFLKFWQKIITIYLKREIKKIFRNMKL